MAQTYSLSLRLVFRHDTRSRGVQERPRACRQCGTRREPRSIGGDVEAKLHEAVGKQAASALRRGPPTAIHSAKQSSRQTAPGCCHRSLVTDTRMIQEAGNTVGEGLVRV